MHSPSHAEQRELEAPCKLYNVEHPTTKVMYNWRISVGLKTDVKKQASAYCPESFMRRVGRSFAPVIIP